MKHERTYHLRDTCLKAVCEQNDKKHSGTQPPKARFKHQAFIIEHTLYIYGGTSIPCNDLFDSALDLHSLGLTRGNHKWEKLRLKCNSKDLQLVSGQCGALKDHEWFMFGGSNCDFKCNNYLWRLSLKTLQIHRIDSTGQVPPPRQSASMLLIDNWLLLYGGVNTNATEIYNTFHFFNLDSRVWFKSPGNYLFLIQPRYDQSLCQQKQKIYLFGGCYRDIANQEMYLNDFYEITATPPTLAVFGAITARRLVSPNMPEQRSGHCLTALAVDYLLLVGGQSSKQMKQPSSSFDGVSLVLNSWVYCLKSNKWVRLVLSQFKYRTQFSCCVDENRVYIFGGLHSYSQLLNDLVQFSLSLEELDKIMPPAIDCQLCDARKHLNPQPSYISSNLIQDLADNIEFPFAAVGLLIDNAINNYATIINLHYYSTQIHRQLQYFIKVEDNCKLPWTEEEFTSSMLNFNMDSVQIPSGVDKKTKSAIVKDSLRRQYGDNVKLASLKLGSGFLHVSHSQNQQLVRVFLLCKQLKRNKERYIIKYYFVDKKSFDVTDPRMNTAKQEIESQYKELIDATLTKRFIKNSIFILSPKISDFDSQPEGQNDLKAHQVYKDIIYGSVAHYTALETAGYNISECVDMSLRAYLTCLYIKNQTTTITLSVKSADPTPISNQIYLERVDKLCRHKYVLELNNMIEYQFKIVEMYYLYDLRKRVNYFSNGLLIYHKNRLITRYKYNLGELIFRKMYKMRDNYNFLRLFGILELPDHVPVNALKTNVLHPAILHKLSARIKLIQKVFKKQLLQMEAQGPIKRIAPTKQSNEEMAQDIQENEASKSGTLGKERQRKSTEGVKIDRPPRPQRRRKSNPLFRGEQSLQLDFSAGQMQIQNCCSAPKDSLPCVEQPVRDKIQKSAQKNPKQNKIHAKEAQLLESQQEQRCQIKIVLPKPHPNGDRRQELEKGGDNISDKRQQELEPVFVSDPMHNYALMADPSEQTAKISFPIKIIRMSIPRPQNQSMEPQNGSRTAVVEKEISNKQPEVNSNNGIERNPQASYFNNNLKQNEDNERPMMQ